MKKTRKDYAAIKAHLDDLDVGDLDQVEIGSGDEWSAFVAAGSWGWWASVVTDAQDGTDVQWHVSEEAARAQATRDAANLTEFFAVEDE